MQQKQNHTKTTKAKKIIKRIQQNTKWQKYHKIQKIQQTVIREDNKKQYKYPTVPQKTDLFTWKNYKNTRIGNFNKNKATTKQ